MKQEKVLHFFSRDNYKNTAYNFERIQLHASNKL